MAERVEGIKTVVACGDDRTKNTIISTKKAAPEDDPSSMVDVDSIKAINKRTWSEKWAEYRKKPGSFIVFILVHLATLITVLSIGFLLVYVLVKGIPNLNADIFSWEYTSDNCSLVPALINTVYMTLLSLLIAGPIGIFAAIYLVEYAKTGNKLVGVVRITAETLTGIPSIVYGLFGMLFFTNAMRLLKLSEKVQQMLIDEMITAGHARAILAISDKEKQESVAMKVFDEKLSVRETEALVKRMLEPPKTEKKSKFSSAEDAIYESLEEKMKSIMGTRVQIHRKKNDKGKIEIEYYSKDELERIIDLFESIG